MAFYPLSQWHSAGQVDLAKPSFYLVGAVSCWQLRSVCTLVCVLVEEPVLLASSRGKEGVCVLKSVLVWGSGLLHCSWWAVRRERWSWNDHTWHPCCLLSHKWSVSERVRWGVELIGSSGFPVHAKQATQKPNGSSAEGKALSGASITLLLGFGRGVLGEECSTLTYAEEQTLLPACVWNKC